MHRAEFRKLLVHSKYIGALTYAKEIGLKLLYLDSYPMKNGVGKKSGEIPNFAKNPDGSLVSTWFFYKLLN